jgi:aspartyl-tRNA(Asn)/glutamyl-tRNA(Gln) amidotransferase subunit C
VRRYASITNVAEGLTRVEVERIARLAHLALTEAEIEMFTRQLGDILHYAQQIQAIDTSGVPPTSHVLAGAPIERTDEVLPGLDRDVVLSAAPDGAREAGFFRVPRVIG